MFIVANNDKETMEFDILTHSNESYLRIIHVSTDLALRLDSLSRLAVRAKTKWVNR